MESWQEILRNTLVHRRTRLHGPFYWTGWLLLKVISAGKYPNESWRGDVLMTLAGIATWLSAFILIAIYNKM